MKWLFSKKGLLLAVLVVILGFSSCSVIPGMGTVTVTVNENFIMNKVEITKNYYIYMDDVYQGLSQNLAPITLKNIPVGIHEFKAFNYMILGDAVDIKENGEISTETKVMPYHCSGMILTEIVAGINSVEIPVFCSPLPLT